LAELEWQGSPQRASLRRALRHELRRSVPTLRVLAEDFLAESTSIDLLAVGAEGELVSIRIGEERDEARLLTRALADLTWLQARGRDFGKLAPGLGLEPEAKPRAMIFCPRFGQETRSAAERFSTRSLVLIEYRCLRQQGQLVLLLLQSDPVQPQDDRFRTALERADLEPSDPIRPTSPPDDNAAAPGPAGGSQRNQLTAPPSSSTFRTGLSDADLRLEPTDRRAQR